MIIKKTIIAIPVINSGKNDDTTLDGLNRFQIDVLDQLDLTKTQVYIMRFFNDEMKFLDLFGSFNKILKRLEKEYSITIIWDAWKGAWGHKDCKYDMTHCNAKGYKIMSQNILSVLEPCLKENGLFVEAD